MKKRNSRKSGRRTFTKLIYHRRTIRKRLAISPSRKRLAISPSCSYDKLPQDEKHKLYFPTSKILERGEDDLCWT